MTKASKLILEETDNYVVVRFDLAKIVDEDTITDIRKELTDLANDRQLPILIDFSGLEFMSSAMLGPLITLHQRMGKYRKNLALCAIAPGVLVNFTLTKLDKMFTIRETRDEGLVCLS